MGKKPSEKKPFFSSAYKAVRNLIHRPWFYDKKFLVTLSVLCSVMLWATLATNVSPVETRTVSSVPITVSYDAIKENFGLDFVEVISPEKLKGLELDVKVSGRKYLLSQLTADDFSAVATPNKSISKPGAYDFTLMITCNNPMLDVRIESNSQPMYVKFDRFVEKEFAVSKVVGVGATVPVHSGLTMGTPYANVSSVKVSGPESEVNQIASAIISADVNKELKDGETFDGTIQFLNEDGATLSLAHLTVTTDTSEAVSVTIPVRTSKTFNVGVTLTNTPTNFDETKLPLRITPSTVRLVGTPDAINGMDSTYKVGSIDVSRLKAGDNKFRFDLSLSTGLESADKVESVTVDINLSKYKTEIFHVSSAQSTFDIINYTGTRNVRYQTASLRNIQIIGPASVISRLTEKDIRVDADMTGMETVTGPCTVKALISVRSQSGCWAVGSYTVDVVIG